MIFDDLEGVMECSEAEATNLVATAVLKCVPLLTVWAIDPEACECSKPDCERLARFEIAMPVGNDENGVFYGFGITRLCDTCAALLLASTFDDDMVFSPDNDEGPT